VECEGRRQDRQDVADNGGGWHKTDFHYLKLLLNERLKIRLSTVCHFECECLYSKIAL
jgi:hypothetical protein